MDNEEEEVSTRRREDEDVDEVEVEDVDLGPREEASSSNDSNQEKMIRKSREPVTSETMRMSRCIRITVGGRGRGVEAAPKDDWEEAPPVILLGAKDVEEAEDMSVFALFLADERIRDDNEAMVVAS